MIILKNKSKINQANTNSNSVRTSVPTAIAQMLQLNVGDTLEWVVDVTDDKITVTVSKEE